MSDFQKFKDAVKMMALLQLTLEQMDTLKGTSIYSQKIKQKINNLERDIEAIVREPMKRLDETDELMMNDIQNKVEMILGMSLEEMAQLRIVIEENRNE
jgi:uncharacterized protein YoxC